MSDSDVRGAMRRLVIVLLVLALPAAGCTKSDRDDSARHLMAPAPPNAPEPDYSVWNRLLATYYDPVRGMDYAGLKARDSATLRDLRNEIGRVDATRLTPKQQLAYWINLYNMSVVGVVVDHYPVESILDVSSNRFIRHDVFKRPWVKVPSGRISLNDIENDKIRVGFKDARIHFAINCAATSCPPIRPEAYVGSRVDDQLDDQVRRFVAGSSVRVENRGNRTVVHTSEIMKWFRDDFEKWGGGQETFLRRYLPREKTAQLGSSIELRYDDYDWTLNDWRR